jgi:WXG100 family type VII secretion target
MAAESVLSESVAIALVNKGVALGQLGRADEAIAAYDEVWQRFADVDNPVLREQVARAGVNKGAMLGQIGKSMDAIAAYDAVTSRFIQAGEVALREQTAMALVNKGLRLTALGEAAAAIAAHQEVIRSFGAARETSLREQAAIAMRNVADTLSQTGRSGEADAVYEELVQRYGAAWGPGKEVGLSDHVQQPALTARRGRPREEMSGFAVDLTTVIAASHYVYEADRQISTLLRRLSSNVEAITGAWRGAGQQRLEALLERWHVDAARLSSTLRTVGRNLAHSHESLRRAEAAADGGYTLQGSGLGSGSSLEVDHSDESPSRSRDGQVLVTAHVLQSVADDADWTATEVVRILEDLHAYLIPITALWLGDAESNYDALHASCTASSEDLGDVLRQIAAACRVAFENYVSAEHTNASMWQG